MLDYLLRKEKVLSSLQEGLINKGYSFKALTGVNTRLDLVRDIKNKYSIELLGNIIENTNYPVLQNILHGIDNVYSIDKNRSKWYLYAVNKDKMTQEQSDIMQESLLDDTLIYTTEKSIGGIFNNFYVIFSKTKYEGSHEYTNNKWQVIR